MKTKTVMLKTEGGSEFPLRLACAEPAGKTVIDPETGWDLAAKGDAPAMLGVSPTTVWRLPEDCFDGRYVILWRARAALKERKPGRPRLASKAGMTEAGADHADEAVQAGEKLYWPPLAE